MLYEVITVARAELGLTATVGPVLGFVGYFRDWHRLDLVVAGLYQHPVATDQRHRRIAPRRLDHTEALAVRRLGEQVAAPALMAHFAAQTAHDGRRDIDLGADDVAPGTELLLYLV